MSPGRRLIGFASESGKFEPGGGGRSHAREGGESAGVHPHGQVLAV
jgi:hypothetical protein